MSPLRGRSLARVYIALLSATMSFTAFGADSEPLDFSFTQKAPAELIRLGDFRLHVDCQGQGDVTVLFESGLGGSAFEWQPVQQALLGRARACVYDRAGYGWSDPSPFPRNALNIAREADRMLAALGIDGPLLLVGHSFGGFVVRLLAQRRADDILGLVLVDASHEDQLDRLEDAKGRNMMPSGRSFVVWQAEIPSAFPDPIQRKIRAFSRMRKTYAALHSEMSQFRHSTEQVRARRHAVDYPIIVLRRGRDLYAGDSDGANKTAIWKELQTDLAALSAQGRVIVAGNSGHHVHADQPQLVVDTILSLIDDHDAAQAVSK